MKTAFISDIHSNLEALTSSLAAIDLAGVQRIYCLGDIVGYGPFPNECIALVRERCAGVVRGNHDSGVGGETRLGHFTPDGQEAIKWTRHEITGKNLSYLKNLPMLSVFNEVTIVHASPLQPANWQYIATWAEAKPCFRSFRTPLCLIGHTHIPCIIGEDGSSNAFSNKKRYLINVGSVGQPRDGNPAASFGIWDDDMGSFDILRVPYNTAITASAIVDATLPSYLAKRLSLGV